MTWRINVLTPPDFEPITAEEAAVQARLTDPSDEPNLDLYIAAARSHVEKWLNRGCIMTQVLELTATEEADLDLFPVFPVRSVDTILLVAGGTDVAGSFGAITGESYSSLPIVGPWPGSVKLIVTAGYADDPEDVPADLKLAMLLGVSSMIDNRGSLPTEFFDTLLSLIGSRKRLSIA